MAPLPLQHLLLILLLFSTSLTARARRGFLESRPRPRPHKLPRLLPAAPSPSPFHALPHLRVRPRRDRLPRRRLQARLQPPPRQGCLHPRDGELGVAVRRELGLPLPGPLDFRECLRRALPRHWRLGCRRSLSVQAANLTLGDGAVINATALAGDPPAQTSGYPSGTDGAGGGHGGRGASCLKDKKRQQEDVWGGDAYSWSSLTQPWSYGSRGGTTSREEELGGGGGGRVLINVTDVLEVSGTVCADGGDGDLKGGGGSGGRIYLQAQKM